MTAEKLQNNEAKKIQWRQLLMEWACWNQGQDIYCIKFLLIELKKNEIHEDGLNLLLYIEDPAEGNLPTVAGPDMAVLEFEFALLLLLYACAAI